MNWIIRYVFFFLVYVCSIKAALIFNVDMKQPTKPFPHYWEACVGSAHATVAMRSNYQKHLTQCHDELGFQSVRFHGLFDDDMSTLIMSGTVPVTSYYNIDTIFDFLLSIEMKPYVELSFMPEDIASGPQTIFRYKGNITPPKNYSLWDYLITDFATHLIQRYGFNEVSTWNFEVWNEPNCGFWSGTQKQYFELYAHTALALKKVNSNLRVGGPSTCQSQWITDFLTYCQANNLPVDFVSTHEYPTDLPDPKRDDMEKVFAQARSEAGKLPLYYSEFNDGLYENPAYHDNSDAAAFVVKLVHDAQGLVDILSWWTFSDIFEEQGQTSQPFFSGNGWGLLNIYQIPKPVYRAFQLLHQTGSLEIPVTTNATNTTVGVWSTNTNFRKVDIFIYNFDVPTSSVKDESISIQVTNLGVIPQFANITFIDQQSANAPVAWISMGSPFYPTQQQIDQMMQASQLQWKNINFSRIAQNAIQFDLTIRKWGVAFITFNV